MKDNYEHFFTSIIDRVISLEEDEEKFEKIEDIRAHTERVVELCEEVCKKISCETAEDILLSAAWIHDVGKLETKELHHLAVVLKKILPSDLIDKDIFEIVEQHKGLFNPKSHFKECAILRLCDKIDKFPNDERDSQKKRKKNKEKYKEANEKCEKVLNEIGKAQCFENESDVKALFDFYNKKRNDAKKLIE